MGYPKKANPIEPYGIRRSTGWQEAGLYFPQLETERFQRGRGDITLSGRGYSAKAHVISLFGEKEPLL